MTAQRYNFFSETSHSQHKKKMMTFTKENLRVGKKIGFALNLLLLSASKRQKTK